MFAGQRAGGFGSPGGVRHPQGGGLTDAERAGRKRVRFEAVAGFGAGEKNREIAAALRASERSVERWRRQWREEGPGRVGVEGFAWQVHGPRYSCR
ncbi:helix-turn-helix domain-containing protein [Kitasatospora indigofera]|uniref:helix-turn-helix domain-containing protein n=1 Tax=Kitasatospora indigofera TaxID=67307 RepID=UPI0036902D53